MTFAGTCRETTNLDALQTRLTQLALLTRFTASPRDDCERMQPVRSYAHRLQADGTRVGEGLLSIAVTYFRVGCLGRRYANGPVLQWLGKPDRGAALQGVSGIIAVDQAAAQFAALLARRCTIPGAIAVDRAVAYVQQKQQLRYVHTTHERHAFPQQHCLKGGRW